MTEAVATDFLPILAAESPRRSFVVSVHDVAPCTREASAELSRHCNTPAFVLLHFWLYQIITGKGAQPRTRILIPGCAIWRRAAMTLCFRVIFMSAHAVRAIGSSRSS